MLQNFIMLQTWCKYKSKLNYLESVETCLKAYTTARTMDSDSVYQCPGVQRPTLEQLQSLANAVHLNISTEDLQQYQGWHA